MFIGLSVIAWAIFTSGNFIVDALIVLFISIGIFKDAEIYSKKQFQLKGEEDYSQYKLPLEECWEEIN